MNKILLVLTFFVLVVGLDIQALADKYKNASYEKIQKDADNGNLDAVFALAKAYNTGTKDYYQVAKWYYVWQSMFSKHTEPMQRITDALWNIHQQIATPDMEQAKAEAEEYYANNEMNFGS